MAAGLKLIGLVLVCIALTACDSSTKAKDEVLNHKNDVKKPMGPPCSYTEKGCTLDQLNDPKYYKK